MNYDAFAPMAVVPPATLPEGYEDADYTPPGVLPRGNQPKEVVILIEIDTYG